MAKRGRTIRWGWLACGCIALMLLAAAPAQARLGAPAVTAPASNAFVQSLPAFSWRPVRGAASYQFQFSADRAFSSGVSGFGTGVQLQTTALTNDKTIPDGTYYWRVRAVSAQDHPGAWSGVRVLRKYWTSVPQLQSPLGATVNWPSQPLVLKWSPVPYAVAYNVYIATDPALSHLVDGSLSSPVQVQGPQFAISGVLAPATYYWAVQPVDAEGYRGVRSAVSSFAWAWPSDTPVVETNVSNDQSVDEPSFSWAPIPGASSYEIEISRAIDFPAGSDVIDATGLVGTSYTPLQFLPNETTLYWRVRGRDTNGDAGDWNVGQPFTQTFDQLPTSIQNLQVINQSGASQPLGTTTNDPIVTWSAVPGASSYEVVVGGWNASGGCDWNSGPKSTTTPNTAWTPIGSGENTNWETEYKWPGPNGGISFVGTGPACISVTARRDDGPLSGPTIVSAPTVLGNTVEPAFYYSAPATSASTPTVMPAGNYQQPGPAGAVPTVTAAPLFEWSPVSSASGYYVAIARDNTFTNVVNVGYTQQTSYVPPISLLDETSAYYWEVVPADSSGRVYSNPLSEDNYQAFNKSSVPPTPISPINGASVQTQPTFSWSSATGAKDYTLQVATDPSFANPLLNITTESTSYTSTNTLPAEKTLYWQVRANDSQGNGLNWSWTFHPNSVFTHHLPAPAPLPGNPIGGSMIPVLSWWPVTGAISYNMFVTQADGSTRNFSFNAPEMSPTEFYGTGIWHWQVQSVFPGGETSAYFSPQSYVRIIPAPAGVHATKSGTQIVISWAPDPVAKQYQIQLATTDGFGSPVASDTTDNTVWVPQINSTTASQKLYWRLAAVDRGGNVGAYDQGIFRAPSHSHHHKKKRTKKKRK